MNNTRRYFHPFLDCERWNFYQPRRSDIIIATPFKSGTTWMQMIVLGLLYGVDNPPLLKEVDHWIDFRLTPLEEMLERLERQTSRRFIKTHLPFDAIPYQQNLKYLVVDRDPRDVFMSLWNHYRHMNVSMINSSLPLDMKPIPPCPESIHDFWETWLTKGYFEWESEGYPFWSNFRHVQSWFDMRNAHNISHIHYSKLLSDPVNEIHKIAEFIDIDINASQAIALANHTSFENTKENLDKLFPGSYKLFTNGADTFFHKGINNRWKNVLTEENDDLFQSVSRSILSKECYEWLTTGSLEVA